MSTEAAVVGAAVLCSCWLHSVAIEDAAVFEIAAVVVVFAVPAGSVVGSSCL